MMSAPELLTLKASQRRQVMLSGGQEGCALVPGIRVKRHQAYSEYGDSGLTERHMGIDLVVSLTRDSGQPEVLRAAAALTGYLLVKAPEAGPAGGALMRAGGAALKEVGEVTALVGRLLVDLTSITDAGQLMREIDEAVPALLALRAQLEQGRVS